MVIQNTWQPTCESNCKKFGLFWRLSICKCTCLITEISFLEKRGLFAAATTEQAFAVANKDIGHKWPIVIGCFVIVLRSFWLSIVYCDNHQAAAPVYLYCRWKIFTALYTFYLALLFWVILENQKKSRVYPYSQCFTHTVHYQSAKCSGPFYKAESKISHDNSWKTSFTSCKNMHSRSVLTWFNQFACLYY